MNPFHSLLERPGGRRTLMLLSIAALLLLLLIGGIAWLLWPKSPESAAGITPAGETILLADITPEDGAVIRGTDAWVRWTSPLLTGGRVLWREAGSGDYRSLDAGNGPTFLARLADLKAGTKYEYYVEGSAEAQTERSGVRTFSVEGGAAFDPPTTEQTVSRDYDQTVILTLKNSSQENVTVAAKALAHFRDLQADMVGPGSADQPVDLPPGGTLPLRLAVTASDAVEDSYDIPIEAAGVSTSARVRVDKPRFDVEFRVITEDPNTLAKTIEVTNNGETLTDLAVRIAPPNDADVRLQPGMVHGFLPENSSVRFVASPVLYLEFQSLDVEIEAGAAGQSERFPLRFTAPEGQQLLGVRTASQRRGSSSDWYCTNKPNTCSDVPGPEGNGPVLLASAGAVTLPSPGACSECDIPGACEHIAELIALIDAYNEPQPTDARMKGPGSFQHFTNRFDPLLGQLSNTDLACRFDQGNAIPPDVSTIIGSIHRARMNFKSWSPSADFPTIYACRDKVTGGTVRPEDAAACADYEAIKGPTELNHPPSLDEQGIRGALEKLAGLFNCPVTSPAGAPPPKPCAGGEQKPSDGAKEAADQIKGGLKEAFDKLEEQRKAIDSGLPGPNPQLDLIKQRIKNIKKMMGFYDRIMAASCVPGDVLQSLEAVRQRREGSCEEACVAMYEWMVKMGAASPNARSLLIPACSRACDTAMSP